MRSHLVVLQIKGDGRGENEAESAAARISRPRDVASVTIRHGRQSHIGRHVDHQLRRGVLLLSGMSFQPSLASLSPVTAVLRAIQDGTLARGPQWHSLAQHLLFRVHSGQNRHTDAHTYDLPGCDDATGQRQRRQ